MEEKVPGDFQRAAGHACGRGEFAGGLRALGSALALGISVSLAFGQGSLLDLSFNAANALAQPGVPSWVEAVALQSSSNIVILQTYSPALSTTVHRISRLNAKGALDTSFHSGFITFTYNNQLESGDVYSVTVQADDKIIVAGQFTQFDGIDRTNLVRLNSDGTLDASFDVGTNIGSLSTYAVASQPDGKLLIPVYGAVAGNGLPISWNLARLHLDGSLEAMFKSSTDGKIFAIAVEPDGHILIGGDFSSVNGTNRALIARLNADGSLDPDLNYSNGPVENFAHQVRYITLQSDGKLLVVGPGVSLSGLARLNADGSVDSTFDAGFIYGNFGLGNLINGTFVMPAPDGAVLIGGSFTTIDGVSRNGVARLLSDGSLDLGFDPGRWLNPGLGTVSALARQSDGKILLSGVFTNAGGGFVRELVRLNPGYLSNASLLNISNSYGNVVSVNEDATNLNLTIIRAGNTSSNVTVQYRTVDDTAVSGTNYLAQSGLITLAPGVRAQTISLTVLDDHQVSGDKTFQVYLTNATGGALLGASSNETVRVVDVDLGIQFAQTNYFTDVLQDSVTIPLQVLGTHFGDRLYFHASV
jgi:uncharacterized delta-60 repeat protein